MHLQLIPVGDKSRDGAMDQGDDAPAINLKQHEVPRQTGINLFVCALSHKMAPIQFNSIDAQIKPSASNVDTGC